MSHPNNLPLIPSVGPPTSRSDVPSSFSSRWSFFSSTTFSYGLLCSTASHLHPWPHSLLSRPSLSPNATRCHRGAQPHLKMLLEQVYLSDEMFEEKLRAALQNVCFNQEDESWWKLKRPTAIIRPLCSIWCIFLFLNCCSRSSPPPVMFVTPRCCSHSDYFGRKAAQSPLVGILLVSHKQLLVCLVVPVGQCDCGKCACVIVFYIWLAFHPPQSGSLFYTW